MMQQVTQDSNLLQDTLDIEFQELSYSVRTPVSRHGLCCNACCCRGVKKKFRDSERIQILQRVSGVFRAGELSAVLGPSGAGKTSLLSILAGYRMSGVEGEVLLNGEPRSISLGTAARQKCCLIPQEFAMLDVLTVGETLHVAALLKLGRHVGNETKIRNTCTLLGLDSCVNTAVGCLSGGEKKRLSCGVELLSNPPLMFFDEPTSGLDAVSAYQVLAHLRDLAHEEHRNIVCSIHQPGSKLFQIFDSVFVLAPNGRCLYKGSRENLVAKLAESGFHCPAFYNPADFVFMTVDACKAPEVRVMLLMEFIIQPVPVVNEVKVSLGEYDSEHFSGLGILICNILSAQWGKQRKTTSLLIFASRLIALEVATGEHGDTSPLLTIATLHEPRWTCVKDEMPHEIVTVSGPEEKENRRIAWLKRLRGLAFCQYKSLRTTTNNNTKPVCNSWQQFSILLGRSIRCSFRDLHMARLRFAAHVLVGLLLGTIFYQIGDDAASLISNVGCIFFLLLFLFFSNAMPTVHTFPAEMTVMLREYQNGWYSVKAYYMARSISDLPLQLFCPTVFLAISYFMTGQPCEYRPFLQVWLIGLLLTLVAQSLGLLIGAASDVKMGIFLVPVISIPMLLFSGYFVRIPDIPIYFKWLSHLSVFRYAFQACLLALYGYDRAKLRCSQPYCPIRSPAKFLDELQLGDMSFYGCTVALVLYVVILRVMLYLALKWQVRRYK